MNRLTGAIALALLIANAAAAQKPKFLPGYLVTIEGDTVRGFIRKLKLTGNYDSCVFVAQLNANPVTYHPSKLNAYKIDGSNKMVARTIQLKEKPVQVYLEVLADGKITLFRYDNYGESFYFVEKAGPDFQQLTNETIRMERGETFVYRKDNKFKVALTKLFADCSSTDLSQLDRALFQEKSLTRLVEKYNQCVPVDAPKDPTFAFHFGILGGLNSSTYTLPSSVPSRGFVVPSYSTTTFEVGAFLELRKKTWIGSSFRVDLAYFSPHYVVTETRGFVYYKSVVDLQQLKIPLAYKYTFGNNKLAPYVLLGASFNITMSGQRELTVSSTYGAFPDEYYPDNIPSDDQFGYFGGLGVMISLSQKTRTFLEIRSEKVTSTPSLVVLAGIRF